MLEPVLLVILVVQVTAASTQQSPASEAPQTQVLLNNLVATAGQEVTLHMRLETQTEVKISRLTVEVSFPVAQLSLVRVERPYPVEKVEGQISVEEMESGRIQVEITVPENSPAALPEEAVAFLVMQIAEDVEALPLTIRVENVEMRDLKGQVLKEIKDSQARINVVSEALYPLISCFFYMH
jgi:hypothetical protein